jgi:hypothetical protein
MPESGKAFIPLLQRPQVAEIWVISRSGGFTGHQDGYAGRIWHNSSSDHAPAISEHGTLRGTSAMSQRAEEGHRALHRMGNFVLKRLD